jgi:hypothetical protein
MMWAHSHAMWSGMAMFSGQSVYVLRPLQVPFFRVLKELLKAHSIESPNRLHYHD